MRKTALVTMILSGCGQSGSPDAGNPFACPPMATEVTLAGRVQAEIFDKHCKSCHNPGDPSNGDFSTATKTAQAITKPSRYGSSLKPVVPGDLGQSVMWRKLKQVQGPNGEPLGGVMPPAGALEPATLNLVRDWICTGAK